MTHSARSGVVLLWGAVVLAILALNIVVPVPAMEGAWQWVGGLMAFPVAAVVVLLRRPGNTIGRLLGIVSTTAALQFALTWFSGRSPDSQWAGYADAFAVAASVGIFGGILGVFHLFPSGQPVSRAHHLFLVGFAGWLGVISVLELFRPGVMESSGRVNPLGIAPQWVASLVDGAIITLPIAALVGIVVLVVRHRRAGPLERAQLRWFFVGAGGLTVMFLLFAFSGDVERGLVALALSILFLLGFWSLPAAIVIAVMRYRLYDIDRVLSRTVSYLIVAGVLTAVYLGLVLALQWVLPLGNSQVIVAASTLGAAAVFAPLRGVVQSRLDRRFNRARYEAGVEAQAFSRRLQREFEPELIQQDLADVITRTMHPSDVQVWLRP